MRIALTGGNGFIGKNLLVRLNETSHSDVVLVPHDATDAAMRAMLQDVDFVFHLAGVNRPQSPSEFAEGNHAFTKRLCDTLAQLPNPTRIAFTSSTQALLNNHYGRSKREAENELLAYSDRTGRAVYIFRLPNVFGKWSRPNYNSVVATFCHNVARDLPIVINDQSSPLTLVYVDDVVSALSALVDYSAMPRGYQQIEPEYQATVGELARQIQAFHAGRNSLMVERVGTGLTRALYATYVSFLPPASFDYEVPSYSDPRGVFVEMLKTPDCGQFGYFTAHPGITRGEHYHHSKTEKFLVVKGTARFESRNIVTNEKHDSVVRGGDSRIVETIPGWTHNVTNIGGDELVVLVWANEIFDRNRPDTISNKVDQA